jgi:tetratricopeptide (TPR) repeat protein
MKRIHSILIATTMLLFVASCSNEKTIGEKEKNLKLFKISRENKDVYTAIAALNLYLLDDTVVGPYHDTLATMYFVTGNFASGVLIGEKVLNKYPKNKQLMELMSEGYQKTDQYEKSIQITQTLFEESKDYRYMYQVATLQFENQQIEDCEKTISMILKDGIDSSTTIEMSPGGLSDIVPIEAACYNLKAMIEDQVRNDFATAVKYFSRALEIYPDFKFPKAYVREKQYQQYMNR